MPETKRSELLIVTKAKDLSAYVMTVTQKSPKRFRFTYVSRLQNLSLSIIENIYRANDTFIGGVDALEKYSRRLDYQHQALTELRLLGYMAQTSLEQKCILTKQYEIISRGVFDCQNLLGAWINSDAKRINKIKGQ